MRYGVLQDIDISVAHGVFQECVFSCEGIIIARGHNYNFRSLFHVNSELLNSIRGLVGRYVYAKTFKIIVVITSLKKNIIISVS